MQKVEQLSNYQQLKIEDEKPQQKSGERQGQGPQPLEERQKKKTFIFGQVRKLRKLSKYLEDLGVYRQMTLPLSALRSHCVPEEIIQKLNQKDVIKSSQMRYQRMLKTMNVKRNWSNDDLILLVYIVSKFSQTNNISIQEVQFHKECWQLVEDLVTGASAEQSMFKWMSFRVVSVNECAWLKEEEDLLCNIQKQYSGGQNRWKKIAKELFKLNRDPNKIYRQPKQCREHFNSFLDPIIKKGPWTKQEDYMLLCAYLKFNCQRRWCQITQYFKNRTENSLKNRFQLIHSRIPIPNNTQRDTQIKLVQNFLITLRESITNMSLEDEVTAQADQLRKQALEGNYQLFRRKHTMRNRPIKAKEVKVQNQEPIQPPKQQMQIEIQQTSKNHEKNLQQKQVESRESKSEAVKSTMQQQVEKFPQVINQIIEQTEPKCKSQVISPIAQQTEIKWKSQIINPNVQQSEPKCKNQVVNPIVQQIEQKCKNQVINQSIQQNELKYKSQTSMASNSTQINNFSIIIPQFQKKQYSVQEDIVPNPQMVEQNRFSQLQTIPMHYPFIYNGFFYSPYLLSEQMFQNFNVWQ